MATEDIKISIVIATYNRRYFLQRAVESALNQSLGCEVVVVDDFSSDGTQDYLESFGDSIRYYRNSSNRSQATSVNTGVEIAKGNWIKVLGDDDYLHPDCIKKLTEVIGKYPHVVICSHRAVHVNDKGVKIKTTKKYGTGQGAYVKQKSIHYGMLLDLARFGVPAQVLFKKNIFQKSGGFCSKLDNCIEVDAWAKISRFGDALFLNDILSFYTRWAGSYYQISLQKRLNTNTLIKKEIYDLIPGDNHNIRPDFEIFRNYLRLNWGLVALKRLQFLNFIKYMKHHMDYRLLDHKVLKILWTKYFKGKVLDPVIFDNIDVI